MANELDETTDPINPDGRDVHVIDKQLDVEIGPGTRMFEPSLWAGGLVFALNVGLVSDVEPAVVALITLTGLVPGIIFQVMKTNALAYLRRLQQRIQSDASQIDNYLEQRVVILQNLAGLLSMSIDLDKDVMKSVAASRSGFAATGDRARNQKSAELDGVFSQISVAFEAYPELQAQANIAEAIRQNAYLQKEITAARALYNDTVAAWNQEIFRWPTKQIVAAKAGYTTRMPFAASQEVKAAARGQFFHA